MKKISIKSLSIIALGSSLFLPACTPLTCLVGCTQEKIQVESISLNSTELTIKVGEEIQLIPTIAPENATDKSITWSSDNDAINVTEDGKVTALSWGCEATITAKANGGDNKVAICHVTSIQQTIPVTNITIKSSTEITVGDTEKLEATIEPVTATDKSITWSSNHSDIATVDNDGNIKGIAEGTATITAKANGGDNVFAQCIVTVAHFVPVTKITLNRQKIEIYKGYNFLLTPTIEPASASDKRIEWSSDNAKVYVRDGLVSTEATESVNATITAKALGAVESGVVATCEVEVKEGSIHIQSIQITNVPENPLKKGEKHKLETKISPDGVPDDEKGLEWSVTDENVLSVSQDGTIEAKNKGKARVIVTSTFNPIISNTCEITVEPKLTIDGIKYDISEDMTASVVGYDDTIQEEVTIPSEISYQDRQYQVVSISDSAFSGCRKIKKVIFPSQIQSLGTGIFQSSSIQQVQLPSNIECIPAHMFENCMLCSISIPDSVKLIDEYSFNECLVLSDVTLSSNLETINMNAFCQCVKITTISFPKTIKKISSRAFYNCTGITDTSGPLGGRGFNYQDSRENWNTIVEKELEWYSGFAKIIKCTDGEVYLY